jgi:hypothetical protein
MGAADEESASEGFGLPAPRSELGPDVESELGPDVEVEA